jgi:hypothetical protein
VVVVLPEVIACATRSDVTGTGSHVTGSMFCACATGSCAFSYYSSSTVIPLRMTDRDTRGDRRSREPRMGSHWVRVCATGNWGFPTSGCACAHPREPLRSPPVALSIMRNDTTTMVRKKRGNWLRMRRTYFRSRHFWLRMRTRSRPVAHAHAITFGSTTTTHVALSVLIYYSCQCRNKARKLSGHVYLCKVYRFGLFLRFFDWILEMFRQYSIFFSILFHVKSPLKYGK